MNHCNPTILLTFDVEDWFQVENFKKSIPFSSWPNLELRIEKNVHIILDTLDSVKVVTAIGESEQTNHGKGSTATAAGQPKDGESPQNGSTATRFSPKATFFILGWLAERLPHLIREIKERGHEVASHGYNHKLCKEEPVEKLREDLERSKKLLEDITREAVYGYRAPNFSIDQKILRIIEETGYLYDSSYNSYSLNRRYGKVSLFNNHNGIPYKVSEQFYELPISNLKIGNQVLHWGGGGYFRLIPVNIFISGVQSILKKEKTYIFYLHPWEFDPDQPKMEGISNFLKFRHYFNLDKTESKFYSFLNSFNHHSFTTCVNLIKNHLIIR